MHFSQQVFWEDWARITALYGTLAQVSPSTVVELNQLNRAVAVAMAYGPAAGLELTDAL